MNTMISNVDPTPQSPYVSTDVKVYTEWYVARVQIPIVETNGSLRLMREPSHTSWRLIIVIAAGGA